ncbi:MAG: hypothetical protein A3K03_09270 [Bdellovibrionales bacterium RIFOXYD1_FULL_44_7]|nr:MAG: hypothetical protein A3K03_09270 [Bdellovibrionales bacterium RIFOXYD1_FULL_44_7]
MRRAIALVLGLTVLFPLTLSAQERTEVGMGDVYSKPFNINPKVGLFDYSTVNDVDDTNPIGGVAINWNGSQFLPTLDRLYYGARTGLNITAINGVTDDSALLVAPVNAVAAYNPIERLLVGGHGGFNFYVQNDAGVLNTGADPDDFEVFPNAGFDASYAVANNIAVTAEADWTFTDGSDPFTGTLGVAFPIG